MALIKEITLREYPTSFILYPNRTNVTIPSKTDTNNKGEDRLMKKVVELSSNCIFISFCNNQSFPI